MIRITTPAIIAAEFFSIGLCTYLPAAPPNIMPLGDSITDGVPVAGGYRTELYNKLTTAGVPFNYVGSATDNNSSTLISAGQIHHEGHSGFRIDQIASNLDAGGNWLNPAVQPDYVLLLIGTNDFGQGFDTTHAINRLDSLIGQIATDRPNAHILVSNLLLRTDNATLESQIETQFNPFVPQVVANHAAAHQHVTFVDLHSVVLPTDLADGLHPNQSGYNKMGDAWFAAIQAVPEPSSCVLAGLGGVGLVIMAAIRRRKP